MAVNFWPCVWTMGYSMGMLVWIMTAYWHQFSFTIPGKELESNMIPPEILFAYQKEQARLSPDGQSLAYLGPSPDHVLNVVSGRNKIHVQGFESLNCSLCVPECVTLFFGSFWWTSMEYMKHSKLPLCMCIQWSLEVGSTASQHTRGGQDDNYRDSSRGNVSKPFFIKKKIHLGCANCVW
jgi:hypothetical protein